ncbi:MAG: hypothetical protein IJC48_01130 [Clostridia bacterium]|nr:hypothetical protein [Clostridia bacterium]
MTSEMLMKNLKSAPEAMKRIPLTLRPSLPRPVYRGEWFVECWYYALSRVNNEFMMKSPELKAVWRVRDMALESLTPIEGADLIGSIHDTLSGSTMRMQKEYLEALEKALADTKDEDIQEKWLACQGSAFKQWYNTNGGK